MIAGLQYKLIHTESFNFCVSLEITVVRINNNEVSKRHSTGIRICISKTILIYESVCDNYSCYTALCNNSRQSPLNKGRLIPEAERTVLNCHCSKFIIKSSVLFIITNTVFGNR